MGVRPHPGLPGSCEICNESVDPHRRDLIEFLHQLIADDLHDMGIDWDEEMEQKYGEYDTVIDRASKIMEELE